MAKCAADPKHEAVEEVEIFPGVKAHLCTGCKGQCWADIISACKAYGFKAETSASDIFDEIKTSIL